ncbi:adenine deaminase [Paracoccus aerodenitrificans]|uniref:adenine deaminase n=1 Tax=Paracoccus aerodenitrificans TaxID=3017781 RepID=UPI0022F061ED|nr:adenine deaminase [Paracoccus aerodenitrificans]WBU65352.1 adenine deaminase [Paracoccus aerodenitrificans]
MDRPSPSLEQRISQGRGDVAADLVLKGGKVWCMVTGEYIAGDVAICGDTIVGIGASYDGAREMDVSGAILVPGFIDTHLHIESSCVTPAEFDRCVTPRGITTAICDPHEIANVTGIEGIDYFLKASETTLMDLRVNLSSCVPSSAMETSGAALNAQDLLPLAAHPAVIGLAEFMNYPGVLSQDPVCMDKLRAFQGGHIDGHAPLLSGRDLNAYIAAGIGTEHEATTAAEAVEKLQKGLRILIREGSVSKDLDALAPVLTPLTAPYMCLCTDDRNPLDIAEEGHLDSMIRRLIAHGCDPLAVYRAASLSAAEAFGLKDRGQIAPGKRADIVVLEDVAQCTPRVVICGGLPANPDAFASRSSPPPVGLGSVHLPDLSAESFRLNGSGDCPVIGIQPGRIITDHLHEKIPMTDGDLRPDAARDLARISIVERHGRNGNVANGFVRGFGIASGAIGSTVCHDHHNIALVGMDYDDMLLAAQRLAEIGGGFVVVNKGRIKAELPLEIAGLMSRARFEDVHDALSRLRLSAKDLGITLHEPFLQLAFLALPVIPHLKITDRGMIDVDRFEII